MRLNMVVGSGPTGSACAEALLNKGEQVVMIDAGVRLEPHRQEILNRLKAKDPNTSFGDLMTQQPQDTGEKTRGLPTKLVYGSDFPYQGVEEMLGYRSEQTGFAPSLAVGGFSNVWGAAALPYTQADMLDWPVGFKDLESHYRAVLAMTGLAAVSDDLKSLFPLLTERPASLKPNSQAQLVLSLLAKERTALNDAGVTFGRSRLMIDESCVYCGNCLYGCPYDLIYNSANDLQRRLARTDSLPFRHVPNVIVEDVSETATAAKVRGFLRPDGQPIEITGDRVFLAAGAAATSRVVLKSRGMYDQPVSLKDSQYFLFPLLTRKGAAGVTKEALYTLSQLFLEIQEPALSPFLIHLQLYTFSELMRKSIKDRLWFLAGLNGWVTDLMMPHVVIVQGYLHSTHSGSVLLELQKKAKGRDTLLARGMPGAETKNLVRRLLRFLGSKLGPLGLHPISQALEITQPGRGFHTGGSFPMGLKSTDSTCNALGQLGGWSRIHIVDATNFPSIPATTITLPAMANAHRIAMTA